MTALIITGSVLLLIGIILSLSVVFVIDYRKEAEIKIRLLFFDLLKEKKPKHKRKGTRHAPVKSDKPAQPAQFTHAPEPPFPQPKPPKPAKKQKEIRKNIPDIDMALIKMVYAGLAHPLKRLIKRIRITELRLSSIVGGGDAAKVAINFGLQNAAVYGTLAWLKSISGVKTERINIEADFMREESEFTLHCKVRIKIGTVLMCVLAFMFKMARLKAAENDNHVPKPRKTNLGKSIRIIMD
jgi:hypothetical protein